MIALRHVAFGMLAVLGVGLAAGCTGPIVAEPTPFAVFPQVHLHSYWLQTWTKYQMPAVQRVGASQVKVTMAVDNLAEEDIVLDASIQYLRQGVPCEDRTGYQHFPIPRKGRGYITFTSFTALPDDFEMDIRYVK